MHIVESVWCELHTRVVILNISVCCTCSAHAKGPLFPGYYSSTHIFIKPGSLVWCTMHDGLLPLPHVSFQILNLEGTHQTPGVDLLVEGLGHANDDTIWISPPNVKCRCALIVTVVSPWRRQCCKHAHSKLRMHAVVTIAELTYHLTTTSPS